MTLRRFATQVPYFAAALVLMNVCPTRTMAQDAHSHAAATQEKKDAKDATESSQQTLVKTVRAATDKYQDVSVAMADGYALNFGCVSGPDSGAMGLHYINGTLVNSGKIDVNKPQIVIYEPTPDGGLKLIGADYLVLADAWDATHSDPPQLMGQIFHYWEAPNRFKLPAFYTLHVWAWKDNPNGAFVNWHPNVSCKDFTTLK